MPTYRKLPLFIKMPFVLVIFLLALPVILFTVGGLAAMFGSNELEKFGFVLSLYVGVPLLVLVCWTLLAYTSLVLFVEHYAYLGLPGWVIAGICVLLLMTTSLSYFFTLGNALFNWTAVFVLGPALGVTISGITVIVLRQKQRMINASNTLSGVGS